MKKKSTEHPCLHSCKASGIFKNAKLALLLLFISCTLSISNAYSQTNQGSESVSGVVIDDTGAPVPGVTVLIKGTTQGTMTNIDGEYSFTGISSSDVLVFSFIGLTTQEINIGTKTTINVTMTPDDLSFDEVVVVGFGTQKKVNLTGAVGVVDNKQLESRPVQNASQMIQGLVPGLNVSQSQGTLGATPSISVRGTATIGSGSTGSPLILIDGMEGDINALNPQDIESISVLKDAAASSIYGSRAPFGVILVTTKKGAEGKTVVNYNNSFRWNSPVNMPNMMDSYTFATFFNDAATNGGAGAIFSDDHIQNILDYQNGVTTDEIIPDPNNPDYWANGYIFGQANNDWYDVIYKDRSFSQEHNLSVSGGNKRIQYYASGNFLDQNGLMEFNTDEFNRYATTLKVKAELTDWATLSISNRFVREDLGQPSYLKDDLFTSLARQGWPTLPVYDPNGYLYSSSSHALKLSDGGRYKRQKDYLYQQGQLVLNPLKGWLITGEFNYRTKTTFSHNEWLTYYNHDVNGDPYAYGNLTSGMSEDATKENYMNSNLFTEYSMDIQEDHNFKFLLGFQSELLKTRYLYASRNGIMLPSSPTLDTTTGTDNNGNAVTPGVSGNYNHWATEGFFGRINYNYKEKYLVELNMRYDGTSRYRDDQRWNFFPSVSLGWNVANETFWDPMRDVVSTFKFRASYGELGNQNTDSWYPTYSTMPTGVSNGTWLINGAKPNTSSAPTLVSSLLTWERVRSWNFGIDASAFDGRLTTSFDYYVRRTDDMVGPAPELPVILGTDVPEINNTDLKTYGWELDLGWNDRLKNGIGYNVRLLLSDSQTKITRYPNSTKSLSTYRKGQKLGEIWGYETIDIAREDGEMESHLASLTNGGQDALGSLWEKGDIMYKDLNGDGKIDAGASTADDPGDRKIIGNNTARLPFAIDISADWKGFDFRMFFQGVMKRDYFTSSYYFWGASGSGQWWSTGLAPHTDYYRAEASGPLDKNINSYYPRPTFSSKNQQSQTRYLLDASYIRLKNVQIGYTLPYQLVNRVGLQKVRVFVSGENMWTGTSLTSIFDPETIDGGTQGNRYPLNKTISFGLSVNL